jgi:hypothetical protein
MTVSPREGLRKRHGPVNGLTNTTALKGILTHPQSSMHPQSEDHVVLKVAFNVNDTAQHTAQVDSAGVPNGHHLPGPPRQQVPRTRSDRDSQKADAFASELGSPYISPRLLGGVQVVPNFLI